jgi:hypothetical protein
MDKIQNPSNSEWKLNLATLCTALTWCLFARFALFHSVCDSSVVRRNPERRAFVIFFLHWGTRPFSYHSTIKECLSRRWSDNCRLEEPCRVCRVKVDLQWPITQANTCGSVSWLHLQSHHISRHRHVPIPRVCVPRKARIHPYRVAVVREQQPDVQNRLAYYQWFQTCRPKSRHLEHDAVSWCGVVSPVGIHPITPYGLVGCCQSSCYPRGVSPSTSTVQLHAVELEQVWRLYCGEWSKLLTSYVGLLPCASTIRRAATVIIIAGVKGEAQ